MLSDDPVIDYMVMEAVCLKVRKQDMEDQRAQERKEFKRDFSRLDQFR